MTVSIQTGIAVPSLAEAQSKGRRLLEDWYLDTCAAGAEHPGASGTRYSVMPLTFVGWTAIQSNKAAFFGAGAIDVQTTTGTKVTLANEAAWDTFYLAIVNFVKGTLDTRNTARVDIDAAASAAAVNAVIAGLPAVP